MATGQTSAITDWKEVTDWTDVPVGLLKPPGKPVPPGSSPELPNITNEDLSRWGTKALHAAPAVAATVAPMFLGPPGILGSTLTGALAAGATGAAKEGILAATGSPDSSKSLGEAAQNVGTEAAWQGGMQLAGGGLQKVVGNFMSHFFRPTKMYQSAVMPSVAKGGAGTAKVVNAGLNESLSGGTGMLNASEEGAGRARQLWQELNREVESVIASNPTGQINPLDVVQRLQKLRKQWSQTPEFLDKIDEMEQTFLDQYSGANRLTAASAQAKKKQLYEMNRMASVSKVYNPLASSEPAIGTQVNEQLARGLKEELETLFPSIKNLNQREGAVIELSKSLEKFVARDGNKRLTSFFGPIASVFAGAVGGHPGAGGLVAATWLARNAFEDPAVKSSLAIVLHRAGKAIPAGTGKVINLPNAIRATREAMYEPGAATPQQVQPATFQSGQVVVNKGKRYKVISVTPEGKLETEPLE